MSAPANPPAFPCKRLEPDPFRDEEFDRLSMVEATHPGMSLRDYFAAHAPESHGSYIQVQALATGETPAQVVARLAYEYADAMLAERAK